MRKPQVNPVSRTKVLDAAQELILKKGYAATSVDDICRAAKFTKGTFFHYFKSKEDLGKAVLERFCCHSMEKVNAYCCCGGEKEDPLQRVYRHVDCAIEMSQKPAITQGCLLGTLAQEMSGTCPAIRELCEQGFDTWVKIFKKDLDDAKRRYAPRVVLDTASLAEYFIAVIEGSQILAKAKRNRKIMESNLLHFKRYLKGIFKNQ